MTECSKTKVTLTSLHYTMKMGIPKHGMFHGKTFVLHKLCVAIMKFYAGYKFKQRECNTTKLFYQCTNV